MPTFGPSYLNVYGARREWELWQGDDDEKMNEGTDEGCAYRGRVLASLSTTVGAYPPTPICNMDDTAFNKARVGILTSNFYYIKWRA